MILQAQVASCNLSADAQRDFRAIRHGHWAYSTSHNGSPGTQLEKSPSTQELLPDGNQVILQKSMPLMKVISEERMSLQVSDVFDSTASEQVTNLRRSIDESFKKPQVRICLDGLLNPDWVGKLAWDFFVMFLVLTDAMILPFQLTFKENATGSDQFDNTWLWLTTIVFAIDICATFNTACNAPQQPPGIFETSRVQIAKLYFRGWFLIDFGSTVPWAQISEAMFANESSSSLTRLTKVVKFIRLLRLMRMLRLAKLAAIWENLGFISKSIW